MLAVIGQSRSESLVDERTTRRFGEIVAHRNHLTCKEQGQVVHLANPPHQEPSEMLHGLK